MPVRILKAISGASGLTSLISPCAALDSWTLNDPIILLTDIPDWNQPLVEALDRMGIQVVVAADPSEVPGDGVLVNRVSASSAAVDGAYAERVEAFLQSQERLGRRVVNGAKSFRLGFDKLAQADVFSRCGVATPGTHGITSTSRALPNCPVLLKPIAGAYGKGIVRLAPGESIPEFVVNGRTGFVEQEFIEAADRSVHRVEVVGDTILYGAATRLEEGETNYCLASGEVETTLTTEIETQVREAIVRICREARMGLGSVEYLLRDRGDAAYIDLNPVSSYHPKVASLLGFDPFEKCACWLASISESG